MNINFKTRHMFKQLLKNYIILIDLAFNDKSILISNVCSLNKIMLTIHNDSRKLYSYFVVYDCIVLAKHNGRNGPYNRFYYDYLFYSPKDVKFVEAFGPTYTAIELTRLK